jgi:hypothetical protein
MSQLTDCNKSTERQNFFRQFDRLVRSRTNTVGSDNRYAETLIGSVKVFNLDRGTSSRYLRINCPWCEEATGKADTKGHLHFYLDNSISRCMKCGSWGTVQRLFERLRLTLPLDLKDRY